MGLGGCYCFVLFNFVSQYNWGKNVFKKCSPQEAKMIALTANSGGNIDRLGQVVSTAL